MAEGTKKLDRPSYRRTKGVPGYYTDDISTKKRYYGVYVGVVKNVQDVQHMGRLDVFMSDWGGEEDNPKLWKPVSYCAPFGGLTPGMERHWDKGHDDYDFTPTAYGFWAVPPDVGNKVLVMFINGEEQRGVWIGVVYDSFMNFSLPGLASYDKHNGCAYYPQMPTTEYNKYDQGITSQLLPSVRPFHKRMLERLSQTAQLEDPYRGWTTSSAQRETPSHVYGMSTPGPVDELASRVNETFKRAGGHQFVMDDGDSKGENRLIRLRARGGAQLLIHDTGGFVYICNKNATAWVELDEAGNVDVFSNNTISFRSAEDINFRADRDLNIDIGRDINLHMPNDYVPKAAVSQTDITGTIDYKKVEGLKTNGLPDGSIHYWIKEGDIQGQIDKGDVFRYLIKGDIHHLQDEGSYFRNLKAGNVYHTLDQGDYHRWLKTGDVHHKLDVGEYKLTAADSINVTTLKRYLVNANVSVDIKANNSIKMTSTNQNIELKASVGILGSSQDFHIDGVLHNGTAYINSIYGVLSPGSTSVTSASPAIIAEQAMVSRPAEPPLEQKLTVFNDMLVYKPCEGPELEMVIKRVTRYPTLEPWGGVVSPGSGTRYHTDVVTTGTNGYVVSTHENVLRHS